MLQHNLSLSLPVNCSQQLVQLWPTLVRRMVSDVRYGSISLPAVDAEVKVYTNDDRRVESLSV